MSLTPDNSQELLARARQVIAAESAAAGVQAAAAFYIVAGREKLGHCVSFKRVI